MAPSSVKVGDDAKSRLEELQAHIKLETGRKVSLKRLLEVLIEQGFDTREEIADHFASTGWEPLTSEEIERFHQGRIRSGRSVDEEEIDEVLYGSGSEHSVEGA